MLLIGGVRVFGLKTQINLYIVSTGQTPKCSAFRTIYVSISLQLTFTMRKANSDIEKSCARVGPFSPGAYNPH